MELRKQKLQSQKSATTSTSFEPKTTVKFQKNRSLNNSSTSLSSSTKTPSVSDRLSRLAQPKTRRRTIAVDDTDVMKSHESLGTKIRVNSAKNDQSRSKTSESTSGLRRTGSAKFTLATKNGQISRRTRISSASSSNSCKMNKMTLIKV